MSSVLKMISILCGFYTDNINPFETARHCIETGHIDLAHLSIEAVTSDYFVTTAGFRLTAPGERLRRICVLKPDDLSEAGVYIPLMPEPTTISAEIGQEKEGKESRRRVSSSNWYLVFVETENGRGDRNKKAVVFMLEEVLPIPKYRYFILLDQQAVESVDDLCKEQAKASQVET